MDEAAADLARLGVDSGAIAAFLPGRDEEEEADEFLVWPENERTVDIFLRLRRQWRVAPMGGALGLDWQQVESKLRAIGTKMTPALADDLEVMEDAALEEMSSRE